MRGPPRASHACCTPPHTSPCPPFFLPGQIFILRGSAAVSRLRRRDTYGFFHEPVDLAAFPHYLQVCATPMDTGTILARVAAGEYTDAAAAAAGVAPSPRVRSGVYAGAWALIRRDVALVVSNCCAFNPAESIFAREAVRLQAAASAAAAPCLPPC